MEHFRLLHLSDLHVGEGSFFTELGENRIRQLKHDLRDRFFKPASLPVLMAVARFAHEQRNRVDALLISGDLATRGTDKALQAALAFVDGVPSHLWKSDDQVPTLRSAGRPIHLLPGNHDRFFDFGSGRDRFDSVFRDYWAAGQGCAYVELPRSSGESLAIVFSDFTLASPDHGTSLLGVWGQGRVYDERIEQLVECTARLRSKRPLAGIIWVLHFAPGFDGISHLLQLLDDDKLISAAEQEGIRYLFCGHTHEHRLYSVGSSKSISVLCAGSAAQRCQHRNSVHLVDLEVTAGSVTKLDHQAVYFDPAEGFPSPARSAAGS